MSDPKPFIFEDGEAEKRCAPATLRNREAISAVLADILPDSGNALEIASGTGEHIVHFAGIFPQLEWQPTDLSPTAISSINAWRAEAVQNGYADNIAPPVLLDVEADWPPLDPMSAMLCINMLHISPWSATQALFGGATRLLGAGNPLFIYGPFVRADVEMSDSNLAFDRSLKERDSAWGLRDVDDVASCAKQHGFSLSDMRMMPANNLSLIFRKD